MVYFVKRSDRMRHNKFTLFVVCVSMLILSQVCFATRVSVGTSGTTERIQSITITIDPYKVSSEDVDTALAERDVIGRIYNQKIYFSEEEHLRDVQAKAKAIKEKYNVEEIQKDDVSYWKCIPKNQAELTAEELEKQILWYKVKRSTK